MRSTCLPLLALPMLWLSQHRQLAHLLRRVAGLGLVLLASSSSSAAKLARRRSRRELLYQPLSLSILHITFSTLYLCIFTSLLLCGFALSLSLSISLSLSHLYMSLRCCREDAVVAGVTRAVIYVPDPDPDMHLVFEPNRT